MIILYTSDYRCQNEKRRREIRSVINCNILNPHIDKIVIFWENFTYDNLEEYSYLKNSKIQVVNIDRRQTYLDFYLHSKDNFPNDIIVMANSDIIFDNTIQRVNEYTFNSRTMMAITRYEPIEKGSIIYKTPLQGKNDEGWSYDTYIFKHPLNVIPEALNIKIGIGGCDSYLVKKLIADNYFRIINPMLDIRTWHRDFRIEENLEKEYYKEISYNTLNDYPIGNRNWECVQSYGGQKGLKFENISDKFILKGNPIFQRLKKVISFCLYGSGEKYIEGAVKNAELSLDIYPEWICRYYIHKHSVPLEYIEKLKQYPNTEIVFIDQLMLPMTWRFLPMDDPQVEYMISRDTDSLISLREREEVYRWIQSGKSLHIMRDHPHHGGHRIFGGMFGFRKTDYWKGWNNVLPKYFPRNGEWGIDLTILQENLYPMCSKFNDIFVSANFCKYESCSQDILIPYNQKYNFIGEYWNEKDSKYNDMIKSSYIQNTTPTYKPLSIDCYVIFTNEKIESKDNLLICNIPEIENIPQDYISTLLQYIGPSFITLKEECNIMLIKDIKNYNNLELQNIISRYDNDRLVITPYGFIGSSLVWKEVINESNFNDLVAKLYNSKISPQEFFNQKINQFYRTGRVINLT